MKWGTFHKPDGTAAYPQIEVSDESDWKHFDQVANQLLEALNGEWLEQLDGLDQRYWDLEAEGGVIVIHLEHYLGISIFAKDTASNSDLELLKRAYKVLETKE